MTKSTNEERLMRIETQMEEHCKMQEHQNNEIIKRLDSLDNKFAGKWVEKVAIGIVLTGITIILALVNIII